MQAEPKKRGRKSNAEKAAEAALLAQDQAAQEIASEPVSVAFVTTPVVPVGVTVDDFIKSKERDGNVLVAIWHPDATDGVHQGIYSGVVLNRGPLAAQYSDGTKTDF